MTSVTSLPEYLRERLRVERLDRAGLRARFSFPPDLQGPPATGHGGGVTAMLLEMVRAYLEAEGDPGVLDGPLTLEVRLHRPLPLEALAIGEVRPGAGGWHSRVVLEGRAVAEADVRPAAGPPEAPGITRAAWDGESRKGSLVPAYDWCLGCGVKNPRGAQLRLSFDESWVWEEVAPPRHFASAGRLSAGYLAIVCDELGWWLGALRQGECGVSNRLTVTLGPARPPEPLLLVGSRDSVVGGDARGRIWQTTALVLDAGR